MIRLSVLVAASLSAALTPPAVAEPAPPRGHLDLVVGFTGIGGVGPFTQAGVAGGWQVGAIEAHAAVLTGPTYGDSDVGNLVQLRAGIERRPVPGGGALYVGADLGGFFADADYVPRPLAMRGVMVAPRMGLELGGGPVRFQAGVEGFVGVGYLREGAGPSAIPARHEWRQVVGIAAVVGLVLVIP